MKRLSLLTIAIFASMSVNAAYVIRMPLEQSLGGSLPDHSIKLGGVVEIPEVEKTPAELCDERIQPTVAFLASNYPDVFYKSHEYGSIFSALPTPHYKDGCKLTLNLPKSKASSCLNNNYAAAIGDAMLQRGFDTMYFEYYGTCS